MSPTTLTMLKQCKRIREKLAGSGVIPSLNESAKKINEQTEISRQIDKKIKRDFNKEQKYIKLLLLGTGEAGKSTLIKQMELIHGASLEVDEKKDRIKYIRQNIFDSMVAILAAMDKILHIKIKDESLVERANVLLSHSQVMRPELTSKDILYSTFLQSDEFIQHVMCLWQDEGVKQAYARSNEYQLLDCAAYFFDRLEEIRQPDYIPSVQDVLRCRVMTTSITETRFSANYQRRPVNFKVLDVGGQRGERRKFIALFEKVTAVLYVHDVSSFDQSLREDCESNRLLESLRVFYQVITTRYLSTVSILTFMNKIDILKDKIMRGANFAEAMEKITAEAFLNSQASNVYTEHERAIYRTLHEILADNPYSAFNISDIDREVFCEAFPQPEQDVNHNSHSRSLGRMFKRLGHSSSKANIDVNDEVIKAATYIKMILQKIKERVEEGSSRYYDENRAYEFCFTCAVDKGNVKKVLDGCKNIIVQKYIKNIMPLI